MTRIATNLRLLTLISLLNETIKKIIRRKKNEEREMTSKYSLNQKGAVVTVTFAAVWALLSMVIAIDMGLQ
jgi:hypothetical protein